MNPSTNNAPVDLYTSYYANRQIPQHIKLVAISQFPPAWFPKDKYTHALELAPTAKLLMDHKNGLITNEQYIERYKKETLSKLNPIDIYNKYKGSALLCFEKPEDFCHREIVADWLKEAGYKINELPNSKKMYEKVDAKRIGVFVSEDFENYAVFKSILDRLIRKYTKVELIIVQDSAIIEQYIKQYDNKNEKYRPAMQVKRMEWLFENMINEIDESIGFWNGSSRMPSFSFLKDNKKVKPFYLYNAKIKKWE